MVVIKTQEEYNYLKRNKTRFNNIKILLFDEQYGNKTDIIDELPFQLEILILGKLYNKKLPSLPQHLKILDIRNKNYKHRLHDIPETLRVLYLDRVDANILPNFPKHIEAIEVISEYINCEGYSYMDCISVNKNMYDDATEDIFNMVYKDIYRYNRTDINKYNLDSIAYGINVFYDFHNGEYVPICRNNVFKLYINSIITFPKLPDYLKKLFIFIGVHNKNKIVLELPESLKILDITSSNNIFINKLPRNLKVLTIYNYHNKIPDIRKTRIMYFETDGYKIKKLPSTIKKINLLDGYKYNLPKIKDCSTDIEIFHNGDNYKGEDYDDIIDKPIKIKIRVVNTPNKQTLPRDHIENGFCRNIWRCPVKYINGPRPIFDEDYIKNNYFGFVYYNNIYCVLNYKRYKTIYLYLKPMMIYICINYKLKIPYEIYNYIYENFIICGINGNK